MLGIPHDFGAIGELRSATKLTGTEPRLLLKERLGGGATSTVFRATWGKVEAAVKIGRGKGQRPRFADEALRLAWAGSPELPGLLDAGLLTDAMELPGGAHAEAGTPFLVLGRADGAPLDPQAARSDRERQELGLVHAGRRRLREGRRPPLR